jgi:putative ABC transport system permease protein
MRSLTDPVRHIVRRLLHSPGFTAVALITLAVGIGANTAIFGVLNGVMLKPLHYPDSGRLISLWHTAPGVNLPRLNMSPGFYFTYREDAQAFEHVGIWTSYGASVTGLAEPERVTNLVVTENVLPALGVQPLLGRSFTHRDDSPGSADTVILMHEYWQRKFGADTSVIGRPLMLDGRSREIIGVMPKDFRFLRSDASVLTPFKFDRAKVHIANFSYQGIARLKPGFTVEQANADVARMIPICMRKFPPPPGMSMKVIEEARIGPMVMSLKADVIGDVGNVLWVLMGTISIVLLIACANVANLLLVRAEGRQQELAIRSALGANWMQVARELLLESTILGLLGGALGLALAEGALKLLVSIGPATLPRLGEIAIDPRVLLFTLGISLFAGLLFGCLPVIKYAGPNVGLALRAGGRTLSQSKDRHRARNVLVVVQVALALVLLIGSGLMIRTFQSLRNVQPGFANAEELQTVRISIPSAQVKEPDAVTRMQQEMLRKISEIPGVKSASFAGSVPMDGNNSNDPIYAEDKDYTERSLPPLRRFKYPAPGFLQTLGTPLIAGRDFTWTDNYEKRSVALVSESMARELWGNPNAAIGKRIRDNPKGVWHEVVGVAGDIHDDGVHEKAPSTVYFPLLMIRMSKDQLQVQRSATFVIRSSRAGSEGLVREVRQAIWSVNPNLPLSGIRTMSSIYRDSLARTSFTLVILAIAGGMALLLGLVGIYGVISYSVSQRTREIGIRMALGAEQTKLKKMFVGQGLLLAGIGVACGLAAAFGLTRLMSSLLFNVSPVDPITYVGVSAILILAAGAASYIPASRASTVDPMVALRAE